MEKTEILLQKRQGKFVLYLFATFFCSIFTIGAVISLVKNFEWTVAIVGVLVLSGAAIFGSALVQYFSYGHVWLVVESDGSMLKFSNRNQKGKVFNESDKIKTAGIKNFYVVQKRTRYGAKNYAFGYDKGGILNKKQIDAFPSLFDASQMEMNAILQFVQATNPEIKLGYENIFQKMTRR